MVKKRLKLGELLLYSGKITEKQLKDSLDIQNKSGKKLGEILVEEKFITEDEIIEILEFQLGIPHIDLNKYDINKSVVTLIPESVVRRYELIAIDKKDNTIIVAMVDPLNIFALDDVKIFVKSEIQPVISTRDNILKAIDRFYSKESTKKVVEEFEESFLPINTDDLEDSELLEVTAAPIVRLLNSLIEQAVREKASDIHIEPYANDVRVRFRIDGDLREITTLNKTSHSGIITRIKIIGKMNIAEKRIPQDGRVEAKINGKEIDMRISTLPTVYGEKIVIRLLDRTNFMFTKENIGFSKRDLEIFDKILTQPYGMILVTGPTGSGKTTTLYTILQQLNKIEKNIITIEDPVEYKLSGINQVQINQKTGLTFASGLRSVLRQDPDIVMVGEIRDSETAEIAIRAAITGHLVLSTLHTNDSPSTILRLLDMGIEPYLASSAIIGVVSQRLIKLLCPKCKRSYEASHIEKTVLGVNMNEKLILNEAVGCSSCNNGYKGRRAIHELMPVNEEIRYLIDNNTNIDELRNKAIENGMATLLQSAANLVINGDTSYEEVLRVGFTLG
ncbi:Flp pilus assembly complex ATPase component TadA [Tissierella pigra]|uniref:Type II secretion system protein GspE n=1 Tax=Tissierella pigra TaxID=2607614 RepID=A0A6N7XU69_9FIRM|nr:GspE/PulE family protein [Tissierella pigra]MBU5426692.1 Flp pilus assembly complex ATPase component TadA [Tissierella pigra]MST99867.1 type II secretion system protein GspE [Tissierella pigra]